jgi:hypothetical protein
MISSSWGRRWMTGSLRLIMCAYTRIRLIATVPLSLFTSAMMLAILTTIAKSTRSWNFWETSEVFSRPSP